MKTSLFNFDLPENLIAKKPIQKRDSSKLLILKNNEFTHTNFKNILYYLKKGDVLVINNTKVNYCKLYVKKETGSSAEIVLTKKINSKTYCCHIKSRNAIIGTKFVLTKNIFCVVTNKIHDLYFIEFNSSPSKYIKTYGELPLPNYIKNKLSKSDQEKYQTIYSKKFGSVAAPTAGLHFTKDIIEIIKAKGVKFAEVTLDIDYNTFSLINSESIDDFKIHSENFEISKTSCNIINNRSGRLFCVGTTSLRVLESANYKNNQIQQTKSCTSIYIKPGYKFKSGVDALITNFHLPKSSLFVLVSTFSNIKTIKKAYSQAINLKYRFYSLGDSMLIFRNK